MLTACTASRTAGVAGTYGVRSTAGAQVYAASPASTGVSGDILTYGFQADAGIINLVGLIAQFCT